MASAKADQLKQLFWLHLMTGVKTGFDENKHVDAVYFDFSEAFDRVPRYKLIARLRQVGILPKPVKWIKDFLSSRTYQVREGSEFSSIYQTFRSSTQGGVLFPLLFVIYAFDLPVSVTVNGVSCIMFGDDIKICKSIYSSADMIALQAVIVLTQLINGLKNGNYH